jgi:hypothetical protein
MGLGAGGWVLGAGEKSIEKKPDEKYNQGTA